MEIDLQKGITFRIKGELGKHNTLPIDALSDIAQSLERLVQAIAEHDLPTDQSIDLNNFKLELSHFGAGSAMPTFELTPRLEPMLLVAVSEQRERVASRFDELMSLSDKGGYVELMQMYPIPAQRNAITEGLYDFTKSFGNSPVEIGTGKSRDCFQKSYKIVEFKSATKKDLLSKITTAKEERRVETVVARVRKGKRIDLLEEFDIQRYDVAYQPETINVNGRTYTLKYPFCCVSFKEDGYHVIENHQLGIIGAGGSQQEAEKSINEEFDYLFMRLNSLDESQLSKHLIFVRTIINDIVKEVK